MTSPDQQIIKEIEEQRPRFPAGLLSREERDRLIERGVLGLYRWYLGVSQSKRNWNPDTSFNWGAIRTDHSPDFHRVIEGFFAVEQYVPDYTTKTILASRTSHGHSNFQIRWGSEEERHSDMWYNALLFMRVRTPQWIKDYMGTLRSKKWDLLWDDVLSILSYVVIQERATQVNYLNTALVAQGKSDKPEFRGDADPVIDAAARTIAADEAAHYNFFLEMLRLHLYYYPGEVVEALEKVVRQFAMPANEFIPDFQSFADALVKTGIYGPREYARDVIQTMFEKIGIAGRRALATGVRMMRQVPDDSGQMHDSAFFEGFDYNAVETAVKKLFGRIVEYEKQVGFALVDPTRFVASGLTNK